MARFEMRLLHHAAPSNTNKYAVPIRQPTSPLPLLHQKLANVTISGGDRQRRLGAKEEEPFGALSQRSSATFSQLRRCLLVGERRLMGATRGYSGEARHEMQRVG